LSDYLDQEENLRSRKNSLMGIENIDEVENIQEELPQPDELVD
jgi:hypothetical protein